MGQGFDAGVRLGRLTDSTLIARRLAPMRLLVCGSADYFARYGTPQTPADLKSHHGLLYNVAGGAEWRFGKTRITIRPRLRSNNGEVLRDAAIAGLGLARLPEFLVRDALADGQLREVLAEHACTEGGVHVVYPQHRQGSAAIRAFATYLQQHIR